MTFYTFFGARISLTKISGENCPYPQEVTALTLNLKPSLYEKYLTEYFMDVVLSSIFHSFLF